LKKHKPTANFSYQKKSGPVPKARSPKKLALDTAWNAFTIAFPGHQKQWACLEQGQEPEKNQQGKEKTATTLVL